MLKEVVFKASSNEDSIVFLVVAEAVDCISLPI